MQFMLSLYVYVEGAGGLKVFGLDQQFRIMQYSIRVHCSLRIDNKYKCERLYGSVMDWSTVQVVSHSLPLERFEW